MPHVVSRSVALVLAAGVLAGVGAAAQTARRPLGWPGRSTAVVGATDQRARLVFVSTRTGIWQVYAYGATAGGLRQLTFDAAPRRRWWDWARVAPDGRAIATLAFPWDAGSDSGIRQPSMLQPDGTEVKLADDDRDFAAEPWSPDGSQLLVYQGDSPRRPRCGTVAVLRRSQPSRVERAFTGQSSHFVWSPDGRRVAGLDLVYRAGTGCFEKEPGNLVVRVASGGPALTLVHGVRLWADPSWSPDGRRLAIVAGTGTSGRVRVVRIGGGVRTVSGPRVTTAARWSPAGEWIAYVRNGVVELVHPDGSGRRWIGSARGGCDVCVPLATWSPDGRRLAIASPAGLRVYEPATRRLRTLTEEPIGDIAWSPSGTEIAYEATEALALRNVPLAGKPRTLLTAMGDISSLQWAPAPAGDGARKPAPVELLVKPANGELRLRREVNELVTDGDRVAFRVCGDGIETWQPSTGKRAELLPDWAPSPRTPYLCGLGYALLGLHATVDLALSDLGLAYLFGARGNLIRSWSLDLLPNGDEQVELSHWSDSVGSRPGIGWTQGAGGLLVFASRFLFSQEQTIWRVHTADYAGACPTGRDPETVPGPCQRLTSEPRRLVPYDVDAGRIVAAGDNAVLLLDGNGVRLRTFPVHALAAALSGDDLVVLATAEIRQYSAGTGQLLHTWPRPEVTESISTDGYACPRWVRWWDLDDCLQERVEGVDTARGLAALAIDGQIHVIRLADGTDTVVGPGTIARFTTTGLVYATVTNDPTYPARLVYIPNDQLP